MKRLLLETATEVCSVAVSHGGGILARCTADEAFQHSSHLTLLIEAALGSATTKASELYEIVLSGGPGSYTSLRVGAATAKGLCTALPGLRLREVPTLAALAAAVEDPVGPVLATINSRRGEVYGQLFIPGAVDGVESKSSSPLWLSPSNIKLTEPGWWAAVTAAAAGAPVTVTGPGQGRLRSALPERSEARFAAPLACSAPLLLAPASAPLTSAGWPSQAPSRLVDVASYEPLYVNPPFVTKSKKKPLG